MKKILCFVVCCGVVAALAGSCRTKSVASTPGTAAKHYVEHIVNDDYEAFVDAITFIEPVPAAQKKAVNEAHASALRTIHRPDIERHGGVKEVKVVSEKFAPDKKNCDVVVASHYNDGVVKTVNLKMANDDNDVWKMSETRYKEIWRATTSEGETEVIKVRTGHERDFIKDKNRSTGEKQFLKSISRRNGHVEVIKVMEGGRRHREVIKALD